MGNRVDFSRLDVPLFERFALGTGEESKWFEIKLPPGTRRVAVKCDAAFYVRSEQRRTDGTYGPSLAGTSITTTARTVTGSGSLTGGDPYCLLPAASAEDHFHEWSMGPARAYPDDRSPSSCGKPAAGQLADPRPGDGIRPPVLYVASAAAGAAFQLFIQGRDDK